MNYREGTWFAVPLKTSGYAACVAARLDCGGCVFGYAFGPRFAACPSLSSVQQNVAEQAIWSGQFGDEGIVTGRWTVLGETPNWSREKWPLPVFARIDALEQFASLVTYSDTLQRVREEPCDLELAEDYPGDVLSGSGAVEVQLTMLLDVAYMRDVVLPKRRALVQRLRKEEQNSASLTQLQRDGLKVRLRNAIRLLEEGERCIAEQRQAAE